jgi:hypothetical protein
VDVSGAEPGRHIWLAIRTDRSLYFPQGDEQQGGRQAARVSVGPGISAFALVLVAVGEDEHTTIQQWVDTGRSTSTWPALELPAAEILAEVPLTVAQ